MDEVIVETELQVPPEETFEFLLDFPGYVRYSDYLETVTQYGNGGEGTRYHLSLSWWRLSYTARTEVTAIDRPTQIDWRVLRAVDAHGSWHVEPVGGRLEEATDSRVRLHIQYNPDTANPDVIDIPRFVSLGWIIARVKPLVVKEAEAIVERIVADLEGRPRPVDLDIQIRSS